MIAATIQRDTFARQTLKRLEIDNRPPGLLWCSHDGKAPRRLYRYAWVADGFNLRRPRPLFDTRVQFCNVACWRSYDG